MLDQHEARVRMALGASRQQLFWDGARRGSCPGRNWQRLGLLLAYAGLKAFAAAAPISLPRLDEVRMDWRVLLMVGGLLMVSFARVLGADKGFDMAQVIAQDFGSGFTVNPLSDGRGSAR